MKAFLFPFACVVFAFSFPSLASAESPNVIRVGMTGDFTGSIKELGLGVAEGERVYFDKLNASGGVNGWKIDFVAKDDGYEPPRAAANVKGLLDSDHVFAIVGGSGTPTAQAILPLLSKNQVPFMFTISGGASFYAKPPLKNVFQIRVSYAEEGESLTKFAVKTLGLRDIGVFYQDDAYGVTGLGAVERTLAAEGGKIAARATYTRNQLNVDAAVATFKKAGVKAVYMQAVLGPATEFIKKCLASDFKPIFLGPSALNSINMKAALGKIPVDAYFSEILPSPLYSTLPIVKRYQADMTAAGHKNFGYFSLEGYVGAAVFTRALASLGDKPTRSRLIAALEAMHGEDLDGLKISFSPEKHYALDRNYIIKFHDGELSEVK